MPAHGDFVRRGWGDAVAVALDAWLSPALAHAQAAWGEEGLAAAMRAAPLWHGVLPAGVVGTEPMRLVLTPSVDRVGRLYPLALGVAGPDAWSTPPAADALEAIVYAAVAGGIDADGVAATLAAAPAGPPLLVGGWWADRFAPDLPADAGAGTLDAALFDRMLAPFPDAAAA